MVKMLASVSNLREVEAVLAGRVDIIDLKNPADGALGALTAGEINRIVDFAGGACPLSATVGNLPMDAQLVYDAVAEIAATGVDFVKIGLTSGSQVWEVIQKLRLLTADRQLIAVLFADQYPDFNIIFDLASAGFAGVMLDTFDKSKGSLVNLMTKADILRFVNLAKNQKLLCGLAGSLKQNEIPDLLTLTPDYLGFRGAICTHSNRTNNVDAGRVNAIRKLLVSS